MFDKISNSDVKNIRRRIDKMMLWSSMLCALFILFLIGYNTDVVLEAHFIFPIEVLIYVFDILLLTKILSSIYFKKPEKLSFYSEIILFIYLTLVIIARIYPQAFRYLDLDAAPWLYAGVYAVFFVEISKTTLVFDRFYFNPTILFVASFVFLISLGTVLLLMPKSTIGIRLSVIDALFMSTSAVCVTGLSVADIGTNFTTFGQNVILLLIQLGGLGIMTFTGFFGYFFTGGFSYKNQLMFTEFLNESKVGSVIRTLYTIIGITFLCEGIGAILIFLSVDSANFNDVGEQVHFSIFHAISGFCNAGFSTLSQGLYDPSVRFNYSLHVIIASLIIVGGLGFALVFNTYRFAHRWYFNFYNRFFYREPIIFKPWVMSFNSKIILYATGFLIVFGTVACFVLEYDHTLREHPMIGGKLVTAFFTAVSPRTAGFNTVDMTMLTFPTILIIILLMWIGASPGSTGGGIKTTTFVVAMLNILSIGRGQNRIEIFKRELSDDSIRRAFAIITISLLALGVSTFLLSITDSEKGLLALAFESVSAYSTVGLTIGITPAISDAGKLVLVLTMFMGRVGTLTLIIALIKRVYIKNYHYPKEEMTF